MEQEEVRAVVEEALQGLFTDCDVQAIIGTIVAKVRELGSNKGKYDYTFGIAGLLPESVTCQKTRQAIAQAIVDLLFAKAIITFA